MAVVAVGSRMPDWVSQGWEDYARRLPPPWELVLRTVSVSGRRGSAENARLENTRLRETLPRDAYPVALDPAGKAWSTENLARRMGSWREEGKSPAFLIGGAEGLDRETLGICSERWSLGPLTLPHMLVRVVLAEQLYRGWSILHNHPYHRA